MVLQSYRSDDPTNSSVYKYNCSDSFARWRRADAAITKLLWPHVDAELCRQWSIGRRDITEQAAVRQLPRCGSSNL